jgi:oligopeptidase B
MSTTMIRFALATGLFATAALNARASEMPTPPTVATRAHEVKAPFGATATTSTTGCATTPARTRHAAYLKAENAYADSLLASSKALNETLYKEIAGRIKQDDASVPYRLRGYWYYSRYETGKDLPDRRPPQGQHGSRRKRSCWTRTRWPPATLLPGRRVGISQDNQLLAWADDSIGRRQYTLRFKELATGRILDDAVPNVEPNVVWADDNKTVFYVEKDPVTLLSKRVKTHVLGTPASADKVVYEGPTTPTTCTSRARARTSSCASPPTAR